MYPLSFFKQQVANCCPPFGEQVDLMEPADKVTETFTGKERDDETELNYFGARYLDPMLGLWVSVDPARQFASPYLYAGNGVNPISSVDNKGNYMVRQRGGSYEIRPMSYSEATVGWVIRDFAVAAASIVGAYLLTTGTAAAAFVGGLTALYGATKGFVTGGTNRLGGASIGIGEAGVQHVTERIIIEGSAAVGKTMAVGLNAFDALLGASDLYSKADDEAFIEDFNNSFANCNNGGDCNSFPTQRAAEEFAEGLGGGRVDVGDIIVEKE
ncbi:RHS repeat-associated core domain-containing protein [Fibrobacter sp. UWH5]|uniref:RHS repeat-associated core domain-containing protein n=1 Tax=Fibrobacter sp. UWH5 TaxID=1896211 RepID=UPI00091BCA62|nr:RHS repeat-associated core domain-containing protein [Fibrobacter sp. UWH5]SHL56521.1 RHS repeat-associated core domain-containing protein [Fibrobacter sp. UWH5]